MNSTKTKTSKNENQVNSKVEKPLDPFAVDIFGKKKQLKADENKLTGSETGTLRTPKKIQPKHTIWSENLRHITQSEMEFSTLQNSLPENLVPAAAKKIKEAFSNYTFSQNRYIGCSVISSSEVNLTESILQLTKKPQVLLTIGCHPGTDMAVIALDKNFAMSIIDLIVGATESGQYIPRKLSAIEHTIIEFLGNSILNEINGWIGKPALYLVNAERSFDEVFEETGRGVEVIFSADLDDISGIISFIAPWEFVKKLNRAENPLFIEKTGKDKLQTFENITPKLEMRVQVGKTRLPSDSFMYLEPDDIILIEESQLKFDKERFSGSLQVLLGSGNNVSFSGEIEQNNLGKNETILNIEEINSEEERRVPPSAKLKMEEIEKPKVSLEELEEVENEADVLDDETEKAVETENIEAVEEVNTDVLENVLVNLRVEIAGNKVSLKEVQNFRSGQIIALGCKATDPVRIITDTNDQPIAVGELVDIEGQLGVQLTKVFV